MNQEEFLEETKYENNPQQEQTKKMLVILIVLIFFGGTYYYYKNMSTPKIKTSDNKQISVMDTQKPQKVQVIVKEDTKKETKDVAVANKQPEIKFDYKNGIKPTDKASLTRLAMVSAGKADPFSDFGGKIVRSKTEPNFKANMLPPPPHPSYINGLPTIGELPKLDLRQPGLTPQESLAIKGFVGNKVIVSVNGATESLKVNESFRGIKVVKIDPHSFLAKFKKDGKIITKSIKTLTELENRSDIKMVKDLNW